MIVRRYGNAGYNYPPVNGQCPYGGELVGKGTKSETCMVVMSQLIVPPPTAQPPTLVSARPQSTFDRLKESGWLLPFMGTAAIGTAWMLYLTFRRSR